MNVPSGYTALDLVGFTDKGTYSSSSNYVRNDLVHYQGKIWKCKVDDTANVTPTEGAKWTVWVNSADKITDLTDVNISSVSNNQVLGYDSTSSKWKNKTLANVARTGAASDVTYDNTQSGLSATNVKGAIDEVSSDIATLTNYDANTGVKNLLPILLESGTLAGLTFTKDSDSLIANGTSTGDPASVSLFTKNATTEGGTAESGNKFTLEELGIDKSKSYILTCENNSNFKIRVFRYDNSTLISSVTLDAGASSQAVTFPANCDRIGVALVVVNGTTLTNARIKPMLRLETISDSTYQPYAKPNTELTKDDSGLTANAFENGCVNLLENKGTSATDSEVTFIVNADKTIRAYGTLGANSSTVFIINYNEVYSNFIGKRLKLSGCPKNTGLSLCRITAYRVESVDGSSGSVFDTGDGVVYEHLNNGTGTRARYQIELYNNTSSAKTVNTTFKPMITLADMPNSDYAHYVPYAKSNKELTEKLKDKEITITSSNANVSITNGKLIRKGNSLVLNIEKITLSALSANSYATIMTVTDSEMIPSQPVYALVKILNNTSSDLLVRVGADGSVTLFANGAISAFTDAYCKVVGIVGLI